eukprot:scaffold71671_cov50-Phaeocystis_antarctica.AAC.1
MAPSVKHVRVGGEALTQSVLDHLNSGISLHNMYGPTEVTIQTHERRYECGQGPAERLGSIGKPLPNVTCYVVDPTSPTATLAPLLQPIGVWGELWLGG